MGIDYKKWSKQSALGGALVFKSNICVAARAVFFAVSGVLAGKKYCPTRG